MDEKEVRGIFGIKPEINQTKMKINLHNAQIEKIQTMADRSIQVRIGMPEMPPQEMAELFAALNNDTHEIGFEMNETDSKSPSQRLRACFYRLWEQQYKKDYKEFEVFYRAKMERLINQIKDKLS